MIGRGWMVHAIDFPAIQRVRSSEPRDSLVEKDKRLEKATN
jgi:hypothetical protein